MLTSLCRMTRLVFVEVAFHVGMVGKAPEERERLCREYARGMRRLRRAWRIADIRSGR